MPTCMPTRLLASTGGHPANATPWLESTPHTLDTPRSLLIHTAKAFPTGPAELTAVSLHARSAASAQPEQLSIPIRLPR